MKSEEEGIGALCDFVLTHDRPIEMRSDDSVVKAAGRKPLFVRRARGYVPYPQPVPEGLRTGTVIAALGGELKDTISLYKDGYVITSQFLGDLDDYRNFGYFKETLAHLERLFGARPKVLVTDLHPDFRTTRFAERSGLPHVRVQHHHAHVLAPLLEHGVPPGTKVPGRRPGRLRVRGGRESLGRRVPHCGLRDVPEAGAFRGGPASRRGPGVASALEDGPILPEGGVRQGYPSRQGPEGRRTREGQGRAGDDGERGGEPPRLELRPSFRRRLVPVRTRAAGDGVRGGGGHAPRRRGRTPDDRALSFFRFRRRGALPRLLRPRRPGDRRRARTRDSRVAHFGEVP